MISGDRVQVVVGKKHPQKGPVKILGADTVGDHVLVDYSGPVTTAGITCGANTSQRSIDAADELISLPLLSMVTRVRQCGVSIYARDGSKDTITIKTPDTGAPPAPPLTLIAFYKLEKHGGDSLGLSPPFVFTNTSFRDGALYLNGVYEYGGTKDGYRAVAPV